MLVSCSKCGRMHPRGVKCQVVRHYKNTDERKLRSSSAWTRKAKQIKDDALGICEVCRAEGRYTYEGLEVHHIEKVKDNPDGLLEDDNLICLCVEHHKAADRGEIDPNYLKKIAKGRVNNGTQK